MSVAVCVSKKICIAPRVWYVAAFQPTLEPLCVLSYLPVIVRFHSLTGRLLLEVRRMQATAPESFYTSLRSDLSLDFVSMMKFTQALAGLDESTQWHGQLSTNHCMIRSLVVGENTDKKGFAGVHSLLWLLECSPVTQWCKMLERSVIFTHTANHFTQLHLDSDFLAKVHLQLSFLWQPSVSQTVYLCHSWNILRVNRCNDASCAKVLYCCEL